MNSTHRNRLRALLVGAALAAAIASIPASFGGGPQASRIVLSHGETRYVGPAERRSAVIARRGMKPAVADSARLILTGQAQSSAETDPLWKADPQKKFKEEVCARMKALFDCSKGFYVDVRSYNQFSSSDMSMPIVDGKVDPNFAPQYSPGSAGDIVVVRVMYEWPIWLSFLTADITFDLSNMGAGKRMIMATAAFRNEPFK